VRHGQTLFNLRKKIQGHCDSPLTELGRKQPLYVKKHFEEHKIQIDNYYCSTSERASDTLEIIAPNKPYIRLKELKELNFGVFEGESEDLHQVRPKDAKTHGDLYVKFGGEDVADAQKRVVNCLTEIMKKDDHQNVLAVSHAGACYFFTLKFFPEVDLNKITFSNCCVLVWDYEDGNFSFVEAIEHDFSLEI